MLSTPRQFPLPLITRSRLLSPRLISCPSASRHMFCGQMINDVGRGRVVIFSWRFQPMQNRKILWLSVLTCLIFSVMTNRAQAQGAASSFGLFDHHGDVGAVLHPGSVKYDAAKSTY